MGRSNSAERIDAGGVDPRRNGLREPFLFRVHDPLDRLNANWNGAADRAISRSARKPRKGKPFWIVAVVIASLLAAGGTRAWHSYAKPRIGQEIARLGETFADAVDIDCVEPWGKRFPDHRPTCR